MVSCWTSMCLSVQRSSVPIWFLDDNLSKHQSGMCIDIVEIWSEIANGQISSNFDGSYLLETHPYFHFQMMSKYQGILTKLGTSIDIQEIWFGIANGQVSSVFDRAVCLRHDNGRVLSFYFFFLSLFSFFLSFFFFFFSAQWDNSNFQRQKKNKQTNKNI